MYAWEILRVFEDERLLGLIFAFRDRPFVQGGFEIV